MADNGLTNVIDSLMKGMNSVVSTKTVVGEPTVIGDTIIIPLVDVSFGCASGANNQEKKHGGAGGFWGKETPNSILVIKNGQTKLVNIKDQGTLNKVIDMIPDIIDKITTPKEQMIDDEVAKDIAFDNNQE